jgi:hypothetical protein
MWASFKSCKLVYRMCVNCDLAKLVRFLSSDFKFICTLHCVHIYKIQTSRLTISSLSLDVRAEHWCAITCARVLSIPSVAVYYPPPSHTLIISVSIRDRVAAHSIDGSCCCYWPLQAWSSLLPGQDSKLIIIKLPSVCGPSHDRMI